jgi:periplasmic divalent cation tolerance protein
MLLAWTTVALRPDADRLAAQAVERHLAACVQIDGPIASHYRWQDRVEETQEFRLCFKCLPEQLLPLEAFVLSHHPYQTPEWIVVAAERVSEKYLSWARASSTNPSL